MSNLLEFDPLGTRPENWKSGETHTVSPRAGEKYRFFKPKFGPFFSKDFELRHRKPDGTWEKLVPGTHYVLGYKYLDMTRHVLQPLYVVVQLIDDSIAGEFAVDYHSVGWLATDIINQLVIEGSMALLEPKKYTIEDIVDMPEKLPPVEHDVLTDEVFGWNKVVDVMWTLIHAIAGDPIIEHTHSMESIAGLIEALDSKASANNSHKSGIHNAQRFVNHTGAITLTFPACNNVTSIRATVVAFKESVPTVFTIQGEVHAKSSVNTPNQNWLSGEVIADEAIPFSQVSFTYDGAKRPVVFLGNTTTFTDVTMVLAEVTYDLDYTVDKREGYTFTKEALTRGTIKPVIRKDVNLQNELNTRFAQKVDKTTKINGKAINTGITLSQHEIPPTTVTTTFNPDGSLKTVKEGGVTTTFTYTDGLLTKAESAKRTVTYLYNVDSSLKEMKVEEK